MYRSIYRCTDCKYQFEKITKSLPRKEPSCPKCKQAQRVNFRSAVSDTTHNLNPESVAQEMMAAQRAPAMGQSNRSKAIDATAEIVMQDYGMTDINMGSNLREGDNCVPKLRPELEQKVDKVFAPQPSNVMGAQAANLNRALLGQINAGHYKNQGDPIMRATETIQRKPTNIIHEYRPEKPN